MHVVLVHPEIHWNTGNAGRTCLAVGATLHLIEPLGFSLEARQVKRAGLDYWEHVDLRVWPDWAAFERVLPALGEPYFFSTRATRMLWDAALGNATEPSDYPFELPHFTDAQITDSKKLDRRGKLRAQLYGTPLVGADGKTVTTEFALPTGLPAGTYSLVAVANGISSDPVPFTIPLTAPLWPARVFATLPVAKSNSFTLPESSPMAASLLSLLIATARPAHSRRRALAACRRRTASPTARRRWRSVRSGCA